jgi:selenide,water dikinase
MQPRAPIDRDLVLVGGGHAHVHVLKRLGMRPIPGVRVTLVTRDIETPYSGMLPGYVAGRYRFDECHIDLMRLARFAGARLIHDEAIGLDRAARQVLCRDHPAIRYDLVSLDIGITPRRDDVPGADEHTIAVKPIDRFAARWEALIERTRKLPQLRLAVVGGGAGGVELALAAQHRLAALPNGPPDVAMVTRDTLLPSHNPRVRAKFDRIFAERGIRAIAGDPVVRVEPGRLVLAGGAVVPFDEALWVTEAAAAPWLVETDLTLDENDFVAVDEYLRSTNDDAVFAAGDVAAMRGHPRQKSGVYAVRAGPKLAENLRRALAGQNLRRAVPQRRALALIGTGDGYAVASRGLFAAEGAWLWRLKQWIDRRWMRGYLELPAMAAADAEMRCGGCAAKVPADVLGRVMARLAPASRNTVAIGLAAPDDAALVSFPGAPPLLQTVDFFRAMVDDPYLFGRIAATHALGDIYAMGGVPETALAIATLPPARPAITEHDLFHMLKGGSQVLEAAGAVLIGGHSAESAEPGLGFAVTGRTRPGRLLRKGGLRPGDRLILTKPLGTGVIATAIKRATVPHGVLRAAVESMTQLNAGASEAALAAGVRAGTDVTGFGLLGHLHRMLSASGVAARLDAGQVPLLPGAADLAADGFVSGGTRSNIARMSEVVMVDGEVTPEVIVLLHDAQTSGGLLLAVAPGAKAGLLGDLTARGLSAAEVGEVVPGPAGRISVRTAGAARWA